MCEVGTVGKISDHQPEGPWKNSKYLLQLDLQAFLLNKLMAVFYRISDLQSMLFIKKSQCLNLTVVHKMFC